MSKNDTNLRERMSKKIVNNNIGLESKASALGFREEIFMYNKDDEDWFDILRGKTVPDADPNTIAEAEMLRDVLLAGKERKNLPPLRLPEPKNKLQKRKSAMFQRLPLLQLPTIQGLSPAWTSAIAFSVVAILLVTLFIPIYWQVNNGLEQPSGEIPKDISSDSDYFGEIIIHNSQTVNKFYEDIKGIVGENRIEITQEQTDENLWILIFHWQPSQVEALTKILVPYNIDIKPTVEAGFSGGILELRHENPKTIP